jgi:hypothetical protein
MPNVEDGGIVWGGAQMSPAGYTPRKNIFSALSGALSGEYHWERKFALESIELPDQYKHIWKYLSFHYEFAFGFEFFKSEALNHPHNHGVNPLGIPIYGNTRDVSISIVTPKISQFTSQQTDAYPSKNVLSKGEAKRVSLKRRKAFKKGTVINTFWYEYANPKIRMHKTQRPVLPLAARATPTWQAIRELILNAKASSKLTKGLSDSEMIRAINQYPLAEDPLEAKATGGYSIESLYTGTFGISTENAAVVSSLIEANKEETELFLYKKGLDKYPPESFWSSWVPYEDKSKDLPRTIILTF